MSVFEWRGQPSSSGKALGRTNTAPKSPAPPITYSRKSHPLRGSEAQKIGSTSRNSTANISTEAPKNRRVSKASI